MLLAQTESRQADVLIAVNPARASAEPSGRPSDAGISRLVGHLYECAPAAEQARLLEHLLNPLGALARVTVAHGVFAECLFRSGWRESRVHLKDLPNLRFGDIIDLVDYVQQVSAQSVDALAKLVKAWPVMASSVTSELLTAELMRRAKLNRPGFMRDGWDS